jgi:hypothetical protein
MGIYTDKTFRNAVMEILSNNAIVEAIGEDKAHALRAYCDDKEAKEKISSEKRNAKRKAQIEELNATLIPQIEKLLKNSSKENPMTAEMIANSIEPSVTPQKISTLMNKMIKENQIQKDYFKFEKSVRIGYFKI